MQAVYNFYEPHFQQDYVFIDEEYTFHKLKKNSIFLLDIRHFDFMIFRGKGF